MADVTPILIKDLAAQSTMLDTDYMIIGGADAKKITVAQMKEALGINAIKSKNTEQDTSINQLNSDLTGLYSGLDNKQDKTKYSDMCRVMSLVTLANDNGFQITYPENISLNLLIITKACTAIITKIAGAAATVSEIIGSFSKKSSTTTVTLLRTGAGQRALIIFASSNPPSVIVSTYKA